MKIIFLGLGGTLPTKDRDLSSIALEMDRKRFLLDCGEGTQKQLMRSNFSYMKLDYILISHFHGDHVLGIPGLLQTLSFNNRIKDLTIIGPPGTVSFIKTVEAISYYTRGYPIKIIEINPGDGIDLQGVKIRTIPSHHSLPGLIYRLEEVTPEKVILKDVVRKEAQLKGGGPGTLYKELKKRLEEGEEVDEKFLGAPRKGRTLVYTGDTALYPQLKEFAKGVNVLIAEATFPSSMKEKASEWGHMTVGQAANLGKDSNVEYLFLIHLSTRFKGEEGVKEVEKEARRIYNRAIVPEILKEYVIKKSSRELP